MKIICLKSQCLIFNITIYQLFMYNMSKKKVYEDFLKF